MAFKLLIDPEAEAEIQEIIDWYETAQVGLGKRFYEYLDGYFETLKSGKVKFAVKRGKTICELPMKKFPYIIIHEVFDTERIVVIYSVFPAKKHPDKKRK